MARLTNIRDRVHQPFFDSLMFKRYEDMTPDERLENAGAPADVIAMPRDNPERQGWEALAALAHENEHEGPG